MAGSTAVDSAPFVSVSPIKAASALVKSELSQAPSWYVAPSISAQLEGLKKPSNFQVGLTDKSCPSQTYERTGLVILPLSGNSDPNDGVK